MVEGRETLLQAAEADEGLALHAGVRRIVGRQASRRVEALNGAGQITSHHVRAAAVPMVRVIVRRAGNEALEESDAFVEAAAVTHRRSHAVDNSSKCTFLVK